jgi:opacity protein-like surface antigen
LHSTWDAIIALYVRTEATVKHVLAKLGIAAGLFGLLVSTGVRAANPLGLYAGAGAGQARLRIDHIFYQPDFDETRTGWTAFVGLQPLPFLGAELQYLDFGHASEGGGGDLNSRRARAIALFGTGTVSLPFVDLYAKAGVGRLQTTTSLLTDDPNLCVTTGICGFHGSHIDRTDARIGGGLGVQLKLSSLGIRAEYVRFSASDGDPDLLSVALLWKF